MKFYLKDGSILELSKMEDTFTYILCPDRNCDLFFKSGGFIYCECDCPHQAKLRKIIICPFCRQYIKLPGDHFSWERVDHKCKNGFSTGLRQRMSGKYHRIFKKPK